MRVSITNLVRIRYEFLQSFHSFCDSLPPQLKNKRTKRKATIESDELLRISQNQFKIPKIPFQRCCADRSPGPSSPSLAAAAAPPAVLLLRLVRRRRRHWWRR
ncbi:hypothetical protein QJS04_geneDACA003824 [Acorus gramineus]|uniref:Uncharacterized protein n=1 Tax=Acorus gramineus TaxID=55184 RepID=A0AAV9BFD0_ACOGR|nr:hypothetical protein QJS04_geneDACA003824 [Acorus gramineus]